MKKKELDQLKNKTVIELEKLASNKRDEIMKAKVDFISSKGSNNRRVRNLRHELAQILTIKTIISKSAPKKQVEKKSKTK